jgi:ATP-dependent DNA ligase
MSATLTKRFEGFAECCLELARSAKTTARRARFIQMAHEYQLATLLIREEPSSDLRGIVSKRLGSIYRSGRSLDWLKFKNPDAPAVKREAEEEWR